MELLQLKMLAMSTESVLTKVFATAPLEPVLVFKDTKDLLAKEPPVLLTAAESALDTAPAKLSKN